MPSDSVKQNVSGNLMEPKLAIAASREDDADALEKIDWITGCDPPHHEEVYTDRKGFEGARNIENDALRAAKCHARDDYV